MADTVKPGQFVPEVATEVASAEFPDRLAFAIGNSGAVRVIPSDTLMREGDVITMPRFDPIGGFESMSEGTALTPEAVTQSTDTATVVAYGKAVEVTDFAALASRGDISTEVGRQFARQAAKAVSDALIVEAETTSLASAPAAVMSWDLIQDAMWQNWGDKAADLDEVAGIWMRSEQYLALSKSADFKNADTTGQESPIARGFVGRVAGVPIYVSDHLSVDVAATPDEYTALILRRGALGVAFQRNLLIEGDRDVLSKHDIIAGDIRFAPHLFYGNPLPAIKLTTTAS